MGKRRIEVKKHLTMEELKQEINENKSNGRLLQRLYFIKFLYEDSTVKEAANELEVVEATGYNWLHRWNQDGVQGLKPDFDGGPKPKLSQQQKQELKQKLKGDTWTTKQVHQLIKEEYNVDYSQRHIRTILKNLGLNYSKPRPKDYRRPEDAEQELKKS